MTRDDDVREVGRAVEAVVDAAVAWCDDQTPTTTGALRTAVRRLKAARERVA